jgi:hypothetical protein
MYNSNITTLKTLLELILIFPFPENLMAKPVQQQRLKGVKIKSF